MITVSQISLQIKNSVENDLNMPQFSISKERITTEQSSDLVLFANLTCLEAEIGIVFSKLFSTNIDDIRLQLAPVSSSAFVGSFGFLISWKHILKRSKPSFELEVVLIWKQESATSQSSSSSNDSSAVKF